MKRAPQRKPKKCKICAKLFLPIMTTQVVCGASCAYKYTEIKKQKAWTKEKSEHRDKLKTHSDWSHEVDVLCQEIARLLDNGCDCVSCQKPPKKKNGGHRFSKQAEPALRHHLLNIFLQCEACNSPNYRNGNPDGYDRGLVMYFGEDVKNEIHDLRAKYKSNKMTIPELIEAKARAKKIVKSLRLANTTYGPKIRILLRKKYNKKLGIYND